MRVIEGRVIEKNIETGKNVTGSRRTAWRKAS